MTRRVVPALVAAMLVLGVSGVALAVSDGNYDYEKQHCPGNAQDSDNPDRVDPGCRSVSLSVSDSSGHEWASTGILQSADGSEPQELDGPTVAPGDPTALAGGAGFYFGADDNLDNGEHDGSPYIANGPSDGGGIKANVDPTAIAAWAAALSAGDTYYLLTHPVPGVDAGTGACADGVCASVQTQQSVAYQGGAKKDEQRNVYDYEGKNWDPESCAGPSDTKADCGGKDIRYWHRQEGTVYVEPGVQVYEDPDPQGSPIGPYPLTAAYVGTCGVVLGGGDYTAPASPVTNGAGQLDVSTGC